MCVDYMCVDWSTYMITASIVIYAKFYNSAQRKLKCQNFDTCVLKVNHPS